MTPEERKTYQRKRVARWRAANPQRAAELAKKHSQEFRDRNPERARELDLARYIRDGEKRRKANREYHKETKYSRNRYRSNPQYRLKSNLSRYVRHKLGDIKKSADFISRLGCSIDSLRVHIESQFQPGMAWENYGLYGWHIDHKQPCASFDLTDPEQQKQCFHFSNLQPLWARENLVKNQHRVTSTDRCKCLKGKYF